MKTMTIDPQQFDGEQFATRYNLDAIGGEFWVENNVLHFPDHLPDEPVIEPPNPMPQLHVALVLLDTLINKGVISRDDLPADLREVSDRMPRRL